MKSFLAFAGPSLLLLFMLLAFQKPAKTTSTVVLTAYENEVGALIAKKAEQGYRVINMCPGNGAYHYVIVVMEK